MTAKHFSLLLLAVVAFSAAAAQSQDELPIPVENDNQFPPDNQAELGDGEIIEGSGIGAIQEPEEALSSTTELPAVVPLEEIQPTNQILLEANPDASDGTSCPDNCLCSFEGEDFVVDCSGQLLTEFPSPLETRTTKLKIQNNKITEIPKEISLLKQLKYLNASSNSIMDLASGSISELPELVELDLSNNRLIEYPKDLKNSFGLTKLVDLNLAGNDIRTNMESETLEMFSSLKKLTIPLTVYTEPLKDALCVSLKKSLNTICVDSCYDKEFNCANGPDNIDMENEMMSVIPGAIIGDSNDDDYVDPTVDLQNVNEPQMKDTVEDNENGKPSEGDIEDTASPTMDSQNINDPVIDDKSTNNENDKTPEGDISGDGANEASNADTKSASDYSLRSAVILQTEESEGAVDNSKTDESVNNSQSPKTDPQEVDSKSNSATESSKNENEKSSAKEDYTVGAKTEDTKTGGVDKSIIGIIVAGMVVVVAGITIKKNWSSITRKFSSNSRTPNDRPTSNANGTTPEEVPLQDKSPV